MIYVKEGIYYKRRDDLEIRGIECIWLEVANHNKRILFALFYRPPSSNMSYLNDIEDSIALAVDTGISKNHNYCRSQLKFLVISNEAKNRSIMYSIYALSVNHSTNTLN